MWLTAGLIAASMVMSAACGSKKGPIRPDADAESDAAPTDGDGTGRDATDGDDGISLLDAGAETEDGSGDAAADDADDDGAPVADAAGGDGPAQADATDAAATAFLVPQILFNGGVTLTTPRLVGITFDGYDLRAQIDDFIMTLVTTGDGYWTPVTRDYGIGAATATTVHVPAAAPANLDDLEIQAWLQARLDGTHPEYGTPAEHPVYAFFFSAARTRVTNATLVGCQSWNGYHSYLTLGAGPWVGARVAYVVVPSCPDGAGPLYNATVAASHEIVETITDPFGTATGAGLGWQGVHPDFKIWEFLRGGEGEVGDLCEGVHLNRLIPQGWNHLVQRTWSNTAALEGHDPCVPNFPGPPPYFNARPALNDIVTLKNYGQTFQTRGVRIPIGQERTIDVRLTSDQAIDPWKVTASDLSPLFGPGPRLAFTWSSTSGANGDVLRLTIKALAGTTRFGGAPFMITSSNESRHHEWFGYVALD